MKRYFKTLMLALALMPLVGRTDQLAWIPRADVEKVVKSIQEQIRQRQGEPYYMVSYCSLCDQIPVEVWEVKDVVTVAIPDTDYFQMHVFGRRVLRSAETIREGKYQEPVLYEAVAPTTTTGSCGALILPTSTCLQKMVLFAVLARYSNWSAMSASNGSTSRRMRSARRKTNRKPQPSVASHRRTERISFSADVS